MPDNDTLQRLAAANPVLDPETVIQLFDQDVTETLLVEIRGGATHVEPWIRPGPSMRRSKYEGPRLWGRKGFRGWLVAVAAAAVVLLTGTLIHYLTPNRDSMTPVAVVEAWSTLQERYDFEAASRFIEWGDRARNMYGYWAALDAGIKLRDCRTVLQTSVTCTLSYTGSHYQAFGVAGESIPLRVEEGQIQGLGIHRLIFNIAPADRALAEFAAGIDPEGLAQACELKTDELGLVFTAPPVVYKSDCGEFLASFLDGWLASIDIEGD